jgi:nucleotide-binding universal stress UspA family protein
MKPPVAVGYDGSDESRYAVEFAAREARLRDCALHIVYASLIPLAGGRHFAGATWYEGNTVQQGISEMVDDIVTATVELSPGMVLGSRGRGGFTGLLLGSTSSQVSSHAHCPTVITRRPAEGDGPPLGQVVVGVDDSPLSQAALRFGFESARLREVDLVAVRVWQYEIPSIEVGAMPMAFDQKQTEEQEKANLAEALAGWRQEFPEVTVMPKLLHGDTRQQLLEAAENAALLVVAPRGRGGFARLILGSTSHAVLQHAKVPVAVVGPQVYDDKDLAGVPAA